MIRRTTLIVLEIVAVAATGLAVAVGLLAWRLSTGPLSINFLTPYLEEALNVEADDVSIRIDGSVLTWDGWGQPLEVHAVGLWATQGNGTAGAMVPELTVRFGFRSLLRGSFAPTSLELVRPSLRIARMEDGRIAFGLEENVAQAAPFLPNLVDTLLGEPKGGRQNYLSSIRIIDARLTFEDRLLGRSWLASKADLSFERDILGIRASVTVDIDVAGKTARIDAVGVYNRARGSIEIGASFSGLDPSALAPKGNELTPFRALKLPLQGIVNVVMDTSGWVAEADFEIRGGAGSLELPALLERSLPFAGVEVRGRVLDGFTRLVVDRAALDLGGPKIFVNGDISDLAGLGDVRLGVVLQDVSSDDLRAYWPSELGANARRWILANIRDGKVTEVTADFRLRRQGRAGGLAETLADAPLTLVSVAGGGRFEGVSIRFLPTQPPVRDAAGSFTFSADEFDIEFSGGRVGDLTLRSGRIRLTDFQESTQVARVTGTVEGDLSAMLALADREPYRYVHALGISADDIDGHVSADFDLSFPLIDALTLAEVEMKATAKLSDVVWRDALFGVDLSAGAFAMTLDKTKLDVHGSAEFAGAPATVSWTERFGAKAPYRRKMSLAGRFESKDRARLGLDIGGYVDGPVEAEVNMTTWRDGRSRVEAEMELTGAWLNVPVLGWQKPPALPGRAKVTLEIDGGRLAEISQFSIDTGDLKAGGRAVFGDRTRRLERFEVVLNRGGNTDASITVLRGADGTYRIGVAGESFEISSLLDNFAAEGEADYPPFELDVRLRRLHFAPDRYIAETAISARHDGSAWTSLTLRGTVGDGKSLAVDYMSKGIARVEAEANARRNSSAHEDQIEPSSTPLPKVSEKEGGPVVLKIESDDAGATLRAVNLVDTIIGGALQVTGVGNPGNADSPIEGTIRIEDFRVVRAPVLAKMFTLASFQGISDVLSGADGIGFSAFEADFTFAEDVIGISRGRAKGSEIGITMRGQIDLAEKQVKVRGTLVPAYTLNSLLGNIPLLGRLFVGEEGSGMFAAIYTVTGPTDDPILSVNPLAVLTPGFLRMFFGGFADGDALPYEDDQPGTAFD